MGLESRPWLFLLTTPDTGYKLRTHANGEMSEKLRQLNYTGQETLF